MSTPRVQSLQLMARVIYSDGVAAMAQVAPHEFDWATGQWDEAGRDMSLASRLHEQYTALAEHIVEVGPAGLYEQATQEADARREQIHQQAEEAERRMEQGGRMGPRRRTDDDRSASPPPCEQGTDQLPDHQ